MSIHTSEVKEKVKEETKNTKIPTHVILVDYSKVELQEADYDRYLKPKTCHSLKEATDWTEKQIKKYPELECSVYQLRVQMSGQIDIKTEHYTS